jgi:hypothetical protein
MKKGRRIKTLHQLAAAASARRSVLVIEGGWQRRYPAAVVMNRQAACVLRMLDEGIFLNIPKKPIDLSKPPRKWIPYRPPEQPKPILNLPYYP